MKKLCGLPTCDDVAHVLVIVPICTRQAEVPRCLAHLAPNDNYRPIDGRRQPIHQSKSFPLINAMRQAKLAEVKP